jgi:hypothetical protein
MDDIKLVLLLIFNFGNILSSYTGCKCDKKFVSDKLKNCPIDIQAQR